VVGTLDHGSEHTRERLTTTELLGSERITAQIIEDRRQFRAGVRNIVEFKNQERIGRRNLNPMPSRAEGSVRRFLILSRFDSYTFFTSCFRLP